MQPCVYPGLVLQWQGYDLYRTAAKPDAERLGLRPWPAPEVSTSSEARGSHEAAKAGTQEETATLTLVERLGPRRNGPVWLCRGPSSKLLVLKLFAEEFFTENVSPTFFEDCVRAEVAVDYMWHWNSTPEAKMFREAMAYSHLKSLQGTVLPISYGFYEFNVQGRHAQFGRRPMIGHVTEYIENGSGPVELAWTWKDEGEAGARKIIKLLKAIFETYAKIHEHRVTHHDVASRNIRILWPGIEGEGKPRVVIFDFDMAHFGQHITTQHTESESMDDFIIEMSSAYALLPEVVSWIDTEGKSLLEAFQSSLMPPQGWPRLKTQSDPQSTTGNETENVLGGSIMDILKQAGQCAGDMDGWLDAK